MHFLSITVLLLTALVAADRLEWTNVGAGPQAVTCKNTYLKADVSYVVSSYVSVCSVEYLLILEHGQHYKSQRLMLFLQYPRDTNAVLLIPNPVKIEYAPTEAIIQGNKGEAYFTASYDREYQVCVYDLDGKGYGKMACEVGIVSLSISLL